MVHSQSHEDEISRAHVLTALISLTVLLAVFSASVFYSLPSNVLSSRDGSTARTVAAELAPQSWVFFTKPPSDPEYQPFDLSGGGAESLLVFPQARPRNLGGLLRTQRAQGPEMANIVNAAPLSTWISCEQEVSPEDCALLAGSSSRQIPEIENSSPVPTICGEVAVVESAPLRWAFRESLDGSNVRIPVRGVRLDVACNETPS